MTTQPEVTVDTLLDTHTVLKSQFEVIQANWAVHTAETCEALFDACQLAFKLDPTIKEIGMGLVPEADENGEETDSEVVAVWGIREEEDSETIPPLAVNPEEGEEMTEAAEELHSLQCIMEELYTFLITEEDLLVTPETTLEELEEQI